MFPSKSILNVAGILVAGILSAVLVILSHTVPVFLPLSTTFPTSSAKFPTPSVTPSIPFGAFASLFASASIPFSPFAVTPLATIPATIPAVSFPVTSVVIFCAPAPAPIEMPSLATIVAVLLNVRFPAVDACPIGIIADAANAKAFSVR